MSMNVSRNAEYNSACFFIACSLSFSKQSFNQEYYPSVKQFRSRSGLMFCEVLSGSKLYANVIKP